MDTTLSFKSQIKHIFIQNIFNLWQFLDYYVIKILMPMLNLFSITDKLGKRDVLIFVFLYKYNLLPREGYSLEYKIFFQLNGI